MLDGVLGRSSSPLNDGSSTLSKSGGELNRPTKKRMSLKEALRWCYSRQLTHLRDEGADPREALTRRMADSVARVMARAETGIGLGSVPAVPLSFHPDAEAIHNAVLALGPIYSRLVIEFGCTGIHPEPCEPVFMPQDFLPNIGSHWEREGQGVWRGEHRRFRITADETVVEEVPIYRSAGRGKIKVGGYETKRLPVEYCPVVIFPDPAWCEAVNGIVEHWERAMARLREQIAGMALRDHEIGEAADGPGFS
jgi:hypothetical protein